MADDNVVRLSKEEDDPDANVRAEFQRRFPGFLQDCHRAILEVAERHGVTALRVGVLTGKPEPGSNAFADEMVHRNMELLSNALLGQIRGKRR